MKELVYHRLLLPTVERNADRVAFFDGEYEATFGQHLDRVARLTSGLRGLGVARRDRFAVMALNGHQFLECYHAAFLGGGVINPLNLRLAAKELEYILGDSETKVCFTDQVFAPVIDKVREAVGIEHVVMIGAGDAPHDVTYEDLLENASPELPDEPEEDDPAVLMYTGGTTGLPKGVLLDHRAEMLNLYHVLHMWKFDSSDVFLHQTPMFHAASMGGMLGVPAQGGASVFLSLFDPAKVLALCEQYSVTQTVMVPTMIGMLVNHPEFKPERLASLRALTYGSSPMPAALLDELLSLFPALDVYQGYGMTECSAVLTALGPDDHRAGGAAVAVGGSGAPGRRVEDPGRVRPRGAAGGYGRSVRPRRQLHDRVLEEARGDRRRVPRRLVPLGRRRVPRPRRIPVPRRPGEGHDRYRRRERVLGRGRERDRVAPCCRPGGGHRDPVREVGRGRARDRRVAARRDRDRRTRSSSTPASGSPDTRFRNRSRSVPSRCRCRAR